jgi:type I restriction enzyme S subunit
MRRGWTQVALGEVLSPVARFEPKEEAKTYSFAGTYSYARGIFRSVVKTGSSFNLPFIQRIKAGDIIYCKIMAWEGAFGLAAEDVDDCVMSGAFVAFQPDRTKVAPRFLSHWLRCEANWRRVAASSTGTNVRRKSLAPEDFLAARISLPPLAEQQRIADHLDAIETRLHRAQSLREQQTKELQAALRSAFHQLESQSEWLPMREVAPIVRREIKVEPEGSYPELGIRSFGRGAFHKPNISGLETTKRLFEIHQGDLVFNIVFAWEGAVAVAQPADHGRFGSHRFIPCVCDPKRISTELLNFYFQTPAGIEKLGKASPGGAGRNRTLGVTKLEELLVPVPPIVAQREFQKLLALQAQVNASAGQAQGQVQALLPSLLDQIFHG